MRFKPLASSSSGNAYIVDDGDSRLLLECGVSYRRLKKLSGFHTTAFCGCVITHEHKDHARCYDDLIKNGVQVYATEGTADALECDSITTFQRIDAEEGRRYHNYQSVNIGSFDIKPFSVFHDAAEPVGFLIRSRADGNRMLFATDTANLRYQVDRLNLVAIECNYDDDILGRATHIPPKVVKRIRNSHMEVGRVCDYLKTPDLRQCRCVYLLHLSDACSNEGTMVGMVEYACPGVRVVACPKE